MPKLRLWNRKPKTAEPSALTTTQPYRPAPIRQPRTGPAIVTAETMMSLVPIYAAMRCNSTMIAALGIRDSDGKVLPKKVKPGDNEVLFTQRPTAHDTWFSFIDGLMFNLQIHANGFALPTKLYPGTPDIAQVEVIHPDYVVAAWQREGGDATFDQSVWIDGELHDPVDYLHFKEATEGGYSFGISKVKTHAEALSVMLSEQAHVRSTFDDGAQPTGYWRTDVPLDPDTRQETTDSLAEAMSGRGNAVVVVDRGLEWKQVQLSHQDIQMLESRKWTTTQASQLMGVPPHLIAAATFDSETYSNVQQDMELYAAVTLRRYANIIEQTLALHGIDVCFDDPEQAMPSMFERYRAYQIGQRGGWLTRQMIAEREHLPPPELPGEPEGDKPDVGDAAPVTAAIDDDLARMEAANA